MLESVYYCGICVFHLPSLCPKILRLRQTIMIGKNELLKLYNCEEHNQMELGNFAYPFAQFPFVLIAM